MQKNILVKKNQSGVTLLELLMVVGIAAVISISALMFFRSTDSAAKIESEFKSLGVIVASIEGTFGMTNTYKGITTAIARDLPRHS